MLEKAREAAVSRDDRLMNLRSTAAPWSGVDEALLARVKFPARTPSIFGPVPRLDRAIRLGLIASEYTQLTGGMSTVARAMVDYFLARGYDLQVFTSRRCPPDPRVPTHPILTGDLARDTARLAPLKMDLWHALNFGYAPIALMKRPFVLTVHGNDFLQPWINPTFDGIAGLWRLGHGVLSRPALRRALDATALRRVDQVVAVSQFTADRFRRARPYGRPPMVIPNGVEPFFLEKAPPADASRRCRRILTVAGLDQRQRKNVDGLIRAMHLVGDRLDLECWIAGDGDGRPALEQLARELNVRQRVRFLGRISNAELREAYRSARLFVLVPRPEPTDVEGFGIVYLEAAAAGTPSLAGPFGGATDAVADGVSGFFARGPGPEDIASALKRFFDGQARFNTRSVRAHAERHAWPAAFRRVEQVYARICPAACRVISA
jgi:phosphatidylinositol alpha-1,6-mannosyltransferase